MKDSFQQIWQGFLDVWNFLLLEIDSQEITLKTIIIGIIVLIVGFKVAKIVKLIVRKRLLARKTISLNAVATIEKLVYYFLTLTVIFLALRIVHIPVATFAFLAGALAVGIGFGTQHIMANFISGFILMLEHPVKVGDIIEADGKTGVVENIGSRCTSIRTSDNEHVLIPNSFFLEKSITNWTFTNREVRSNLSIGIAYSSDIHKATKLMLKAVKECKNKNLSKDREPFVLFSDFANSTLVFDVFFWMKVENIVDRLEAKSDIRYRLNDILTEAGIVIAFPQTDVHLDTTKPIDLRITKNV